jgi:dTDP-4-dehydrorhamnose 3,5-epimerase
LSKTASVIYKVDQVYHKESERGIRYDDPTLAIDWLDANEIIVSERILLPSLTKLIGISKRV